MSRISRARTGAVNTAWLVFLASLVVLGLLVVMLLWEKDDGSQSSSGPPLVVYCAAAMKLPVEAIAKQYEQEFGVEVRLQYGGSQSLLANIELTRQGDLFLPADDSYTEIAQQKKLLGESIPVASMSAVLAVKKGNPKNIHSLEELLRPETRISQADPEVTAVGKLSRAALEKSGKWEAFRKAGTVVKLTINDVASDIKVGAVDAGIVWDATVKQFPDLEAVPLAELAGTVAHVSVSVLASSTQPAAALRFARYLSARDKGLLEFKRHGFEPVEGDAWAVKPELLLFAGAMLHSTIEDTLSAFEEREGVRVTRVYNGCGILVGQIRAGELPDAYFACDSSFMDQVRDSFVDRVEVSTNRLVILVPKGNPHGIKALKDLGNPGLRIGVGHEKQCALGVLTQQTFKEGGVHGTVMKNVKVQSPTGDMLVNQLRTGSLDAIVAYLSNAASAEKELDAISIDGLPCSIAVQPLAVGKDSRHKHLTARLMTALQSSDSRSRFEANGFQWKAK